MSKVKIVKYADPRVSVHTLTVGELEKRKELLNLIRAGLKENLSPEVYREVKAELGELFLI